MESIPHALNLPPAATQGLEMVVEALRTHAGDALASVVLFGSGAEGRLRLRSDVNLLVVIRGVDLKALEPARDLLRSAQALAHVRLMILDVSEVEDALQSFPEKVDDILRRSQVLMGVHPFAGKQVDRRRLVERLDQVLLNQVLRLRERCLYQGLREEQATHVVAEAAGPLRACAASYMGLQGKPLPPKEALAAFVTAQAPAFQPLLGQLSEARETDRLAPGAAAGALSSCIALAEALRKAVKGVQS